MGLSYRSNLYLTYIIGFVVFIFVVNWAFDGVDRVRSLTPAIKRPSHDAKWLLGIELPPQKVLRRATIRSTWATSTRGLGIPYEYKFIIGGYKHLPWAPIIDAEIAAHNDILVLEDFIPDDKETANHLKFIALCDHLAKQEQETGKRYEFVSKVDDDVWFNIPPFYDHFIAPRLPGGPKYRSEGITVIGRPFNWGGNRGFIYTSGRMYTVNWPHVKIMGAEYAADPTFDYETLSLAEDMLPEYFLHRDKIDHEFVPMEVEQAWDIGIEYLVNNETILIHCIKVDERMLELSALFDDHGRWNGKLMNGLTNFNRTCPDAISRCGEVSDEELEQLRKGWESYTGPPGYQPDSKQTLDWQMIVAKINVEDRAKMADIFPLTLPGNNDSVYLSPRPFEPIGPATGP